MPMPPPFTRSPYGALANFGGNDDNVIHPDQSLAARGIEVAPRDFSLPNQGDQIDRPPSSGGRARELKISDALGPEILHWLGQQGSIRAGGQREFNALMNPPAAEGPSAADLAANPNAPPVRFTRPPDAGAALNRARALFKQGVISADQFNALVAKYQPPAPM